MATTRTAWDIYSEIGDIASKTYNVPKSDIWIIADEKGHGTHTHTDQCKRGCMAHCDNSDRIVTIRYNGRYEAVYGIYNNSIQLWMD